MLSIKREAIWMALLTCGATAWAQPRYESYYLYLGNYPSNDSPGYHRNVQGLAHDADHWFISHLYLPPPVGSEETGAIWRIPVEHDLDDVSPSDPGVTRTFLTDYPALANYNHVGDIVHYEFLSSWILNMTLECDGVQQYIAVLDAGTSLAYLDHGSLPQQKCGWAAVDPAGFLYSSEGHPDTLVKYQVDWDALRNSPPVLNIQLVDILPIRDENGAPLQLHHAQGGEFSPSGDLLYMSSGYYTDTDPITEGLHVFDAQSWVRVQHSTNGYGYFNYQFEPGGVTAQEPEGLTLWDLDDGRAPGIRGQLHALLLDNSGVLSDEIFIKHYTHIIRVDRNNAGAEDGTPERPFRTVGGAVNLAWNGAEIRTRAGTYPEAIMISRRLRMTAEGGTVRIGG